MSIRNKRIYVAGSHGMVGSATIRALEKQGFDKILSTSSQELDLTEQDSTRLFFEKEVPQYVILAAAKVGGILANDSKRADFLYTNLIIQANVIEAAFRSGVEKLIFLGSSCIYPRMATQPIREEAILTGPLEDTNEPYAIAKIAGIKLCESYFRQHNANFYSLMPTNLYGPNDNFDLASSHVIPALMRKMHEAKEKSLDDVVVWGTGRPRREFMFVDDLAEAVVFFVENVEAKEVYCEGVSQINIGCGMDLEIAQLAETIRDIVGFTGTIRYDVEKPDGTPRKLLDVSRLSKMGWTHRTSLESGLKATYEWYLSSAWAAC